MCAYACLYLWSDGKLASSKKKTASGMCLFGIFPARNQWNSHLALFFDWTIGQWICICCKFRFRNHQNNLILAFAASQKKEMVTLDGVT
jgi:hypothetical protein